jgi:hypothetical protein
MRYTFGVLGFSCVLLAAGSASACPSPNNIEGVAFTGNETVNWSAIEALGTSGSNFLKAGELDEVSYRYVSHYSRKAMAYVGNVGLSYQSGVTVNCMGVILDPGDTGESGQIEKSRFDFAQAVKVELSWLVANDLVELTADKIEEIYDSLAKATNGGVQFWTCCKSVLGYNSWYGYDEQTGVWGSAAGVDGVNAVRNVQGVYGGCSVIKMEFELPPAQLEGSAGILLPSSRHVPAGMAVHHEGGLAIRLPQEWCSEGTVTVRKPNGQCVAVVPVVPGTRRVSIDQQDTPLLSGWYSIEFRSGTQHIRRASLIIR